MKPKLLVLDDWENRIATSPCWMELDHLVEIQFLQVPLDSVADGDLSEVQFLMALRERTPLTDEVFARMPNLRLVLQTGGHAYHIDQLSAKRRGISIALGRQVLSPLTAVPELTMALMLGVMHLLPQAQHAMRTGKWPLLTGRTLRGRRLGILGMGRHGTRVANLARTAFQMEVVAWARPGAPKDQLEATVRLPLNELLRSCDVVSLHLRLSKESTGLLTFERLQSMKNGSVLINTSRGAIVDEEALIESLQKGPLAGAGLDVFAQEPLPAESPLRSLPNVLLTPHIGWTVEEVFVEFSRIASTQLQQYLQGSLPASELLVPVA
jgi:phosphoglycerate dehydrogenase-like enzyme